MTILPSLPIDNLLVGIDRTNNTVTLLVPNDELLSGVIEYRLDDPDPSSTDAAEFQLCSEHMTEHRFDLSL
jgi:hypothetical protein